jgi:hypothetical protein
MYSGVALAASPVNRVTEMHTQTGDVIFDRSAAGVNASVGTGTGFKVGESSQQAYDSISCKDLINIALNLGMKRKKGNKADKLQLAKDIKEAMRKG